MTAIKRTMHGFSLMELVITLVIVTTLGVVAMTIYRPTDVTVRYQAEELRAAIRHMQMVALAWGVTLRFRATANSYSVTCDTSTTAPCPASTSTAITDPATGNPFSVTLDTGLALAAPATDLRVDALGRPRDASALLLLDSTYAVSASGSTTSTVTVKPLTGFVAVSP